jgi:hypothetical protein
MRMAEQTIEGGRRMQVPVLIQPLPDGRYRARAGAPFDITIEAPTRDEALQNCRSEIHKQLAGGEMVAVEVPPWEHPAKAHIGGWDPADPRIQEWERLMQEYRRQMDEDPDVL